MKFVQINNVLKKVRTVYHICFIWKVSKVVFVLTMKNGIVVFQ